MRASREYLGERGAPARAIDHADLGLARCGRRHRRLNPLPAIRALALLQPPLPPQAPVAHRDMGERPSVRDTEEQLPSRDLQAPGRWLRTRSSGRLIAAQVGSAASRRTQQRRRRYYTEAGATREPIQRRPDSSASSVASVSAGPTRTAASSLEERVDASGRVELQPLRRRERPPVVKNGRPEPSLVCTTVAASGGHRVSRLSRSWCR
jgi:hypothetical protein